jgi:hypothetical protein
MSWQRTYEWYRYRALASVGYDMTQWLRVTQHRAWRAKIASMNAASLDACEISPQGVATWASGWRSYTPLQYPEFDICRPPAEESQFDVLIADQVLEHLEDPWAATANMRAMLRRDGTAFITAPFLVRVHGSPNDYSRWTEAGLRKLLEKSGFRDIETTAWGNRACAKANFRRWAEFGWGRSLKNEPNFPCNVWAFARR